MSIKLSQNLLPATLIHFITHNIDHRKQILLEIFIVVWNSSQRGKKTTFSNIVINDHSLVKALPSRLTCTLSVAGQAQGSVLCLNPLLSPINRRKDRLLSGFPCRTRPDIYQLPSGTKRGI